MEEMKMKIKEIKFIAEDGTEASVAIQEGYDVSIIENITGGNAYLQVEGNRMMTDIIRSVVVHPKHVTTSKLMEVFESAIKLL